MSAPRPRRLLQGDESALYEALASELVRVVRRLVNTDPATVEDACQFAWLQLLRCQPNRDSVRAWLVTVARNEAIRLARIRFRAPMIVDGDQGARAPEPATPTDAFQLDEALAILASLPPRQRDLYALKVLGFSYAEISRITGRSYATVNRQLVRASARIRRARG